MEEMFRVLCWEIAIYGEGAKDKCTPGVSSNGLSVFLDGKKSDT